MSPTTPSPGADHGFQASQGFGAPASLEVIVTTLIFGVVFLGKEIGWRGFLLLRLCELMPGRRAALLTGACDASFICRC